MVEISRKIKEEGLFSGINNFNVTKFEEKLYFMHDLLQTDKLQTSGIGAYLKRNIIKCRETRILEKEDELNVFEKDIFDYINVTFMYDFSMRESCDLEKDTLKNKMAEIDIKSAESRENISSLENLNQKLTDVLISLEDQLETLPHTSVSAIDDKEPKSEPKNDPHYASDGTPTNSEFVQPSSVSYIKITTLLG